MGFFWSQLFVTPKYPTASFAGKTVIVTGSNVGLGKEAARHFARLGADTVILAVRNLEAGEKAKQDIIETTKRDASVVDVWHLDLANFASVEAFAQRAVQLPRVDVLLENAAVATPTFSLVEGHERTITVNVLGTYLLALLMLPKLKADAKTFGINPILAIVSSEVHAWSRFPEKNEEKIFAALSDPKTKTIGERYQTSKLLEVLINRQLAPKLNGTGVVLNMLNPGLCHSSLGRDAGISLAILKFFLARSTEVGSRTLVAAATAGEESHGKYMHDGKVNEGELSGFVKSEAGKKVGERLWKELLGILEAVHPGIGKNV